MKPKVACILIGIFIGWCTVPLVRASETAKDITHYIDALRRIIVLMEQSQAYLQQTADNTRAIREKLGAK